jgi:hypothetical protein
MRILFDKSVSIDLHGEILNIDLAIEVLIKYPKEIHRFSIESVFRNMFENLSLYDLDRSKKRFFIAVIQADVIDIEFSLLNKDLILEVYRMDFPKKKFIQSLFKYSLSLNREHNQFMDLNYAKDILLHHAHSLNDKDIYDGIESVFVIIELTKEWDEQLSFLLTALKNILKRLSTNSYNRKALLKLELWEEKLKKRQQQQH